MLFLLGNSLLDHPHRLQLTPRRIAMLFRSHSRCLSTGLGVGFGSARLQVRFGHTGLGGGESVGVLRDGVGRHLFRFSGDFSHVGGVAGVKDSLLLGWEHLIRCNC